MSRIKRTSPALVISILALIAALVVPALAQVATTALTKSEKVVVRKIARGQANKQITRRAPGLNVNSADTANQANTANNLDGLDSTAFARVVARATLEIDPSNLSPGGCEVEQFDGGPFSGVQGGDLALVFPFVTTGLEPSNRRQATPGRVVFTLCNYGPSDHDAAAASFEVVVLRGSPQGL